MATVSHPQEEIEKALRQKLGLADPQFRLEQMGSRVSGSVISSSFEGKGDRERQEMLWHALDEAFGEESDKKVGILLPYTPEEWNVDLEGLHDRD